MLNKIITAILLGTMSVTAATAGGGDGCYMYTKDNYRGNEWAMWGASYDIIDFDIRPEWNDEVSSARVIGNCSLMLYEHSQYRGGGVLVTNAFSKLKIVNGGFNDKASSAKCTCS